MIRSEVEIAEYSAALRSQGQRLGFTCGVFDIVHEGHVRYLEQARALCDHLIVAVNDDVSARAVKPAGLPLRDAQGRAILIEAFRAVDSVVLMPDERPLRLLELIQPDLYIKGGDYRAADLKSAGTVEAYGGEIRIIDVGIDLSSTELRRRMRDV